MPVSPEKAMQTACAEARKWLGATSPNPAVGAVALDSHGEILAVTAHTRAGELHAEAMLIAKAHSEGFLDKIHTLCVTLEPCNHQGRTPPCVDAIIRSGIKRVVIGTRDPNPHIKGGGIEKLQQVGIEVVCGVNEEECKQLIHAFAYSVKTGKPWITVKRAFNTNGTMIPPPGQKVFTSKESLRLAHRIRKKCDAIITGSSTVLADSPLFTVRHTPDYLEKRRWLAILDRRGRVPESFATAAKLRHIDTVFYRDVNEAIKDLAVKGVQDILVEAGPALSQAILDAGLWEMAVTIYQGEPDRVEATFNPRTKLPFDIKQFRWEWWLPEEF